MRILFFIIFIFPQVNQAQSAIWPETLEVTASSLKLRDAPNLNSKVLATMLQGTILENRSNISDDQLEWAEIDGMSAYWLKVRHNGQEGFVFGAYVVSRFNLYYENTSIEYLPKVKNWYALYSTPKGDELRKIEVYTSLDSNEMSGGLDLVLHSRNQAESKFIIGTNQEFKTGIVGDFFNRLQNDESRFATDMVLEAGKNINLFSPAFSPQRPKISYALLGTGSFEIEQSWLVQKNFKIWLTQNQNPGNDHFIKQDLTPFFGPPGETCILNWFGDLDGDGKPDMLMNRCSEGNGCRDVLFLSSEAKQGELLRPVSYFYWGLGC